MRKALPLFTLVPALLAAPALAQLAPAERGALHGLTDPVGATVGHIDAAAGQAVDTANLTLATREQVRAGAEIYDSSGNSIGTVQSVEADTAVVVREGMLYQVPVADIYHGAVGAAPGLVTKLSRAEIQARTTAAIESR